VLHSLDWRVSPLDILRCEREYPGLMDDLSTEAWQRRLVRDQMRGANPPGNPHWPDDWTIDGNSE
jgi:hypothetical protein